MSDLREQLAEAAAVWSIGNPIAAWRLAEDDHAVKLGKIWGGQIADAVMAVVQPEIERLRTQLAEAEEAIPLYAAAAENAEAERDRLRARLTGVAIHANRLANCISPAWAALTDLRAALDQPAPEEP